MRAQSAVLGVAAAAALSGTAAALPCVRMAPASTAVQEFSCNAPDANPNQAEDQQRPESRSEPPSAQPELSPPAAEVDVLADPELFASRGIKITNLQATMTSNKYVAGRLPVAASRPIEDLIMFSPDYLTVKMLPALPKRNPVGVGLVTVPKPPAKESDKTPEVPGFPRTRP